MLSWPWPGVDLELSLIWGVALLGSKFAQPFVVAALN